MSNSLIKDIFNCVSNKIEESNKKQQRQLEAVRQNEVLNASTALKVNLTPDIEKIFKKNVYFQDCGRINISACEYDFQNQYWKLILETITETKQDLENPRVVISLNDVAKTYFFEMHMQMEHDFQELCLLRQAPNANPVHIRIAEGQLCQKYELLRHEMSFVFIKRISDGVNSIIKIGCLFR